MLTRLGETPLAVRTSSRQYFHLVLVAGLAVLLVAPGCSRKKNSVTSRFYHNMTARYNPLFNGRMAFKEGTDKMREAYQEDYQQLLPVFIYTNEDNASTIFPEMDRTLEKCSKTIENHSMIFKNKEVNRWIDDSWLLMGKGHFYKRDLTLAKQTFDYTAKRYKDTESRYPALMWLARVNIEEEDYNKAGRLLDLIAGEGKLPQSLKAEYSAIYADFYIKQRNYALAIPELKDAIEHVRKKKTKTRWLFLLAQLYELDGNPGFASGLYAQVIKRNPPYDMAFAAKIKRALAFDVSSGDPEAIKKILFKMLRDDKNREYKDQIYYALAEIELKEKHDSLGIDYLKKATREGSSDTRVKGLAFLRLADIHFAVPKYRLAQAYYDSTVQFINPTHPDIDAIRGKAESLTQLVQDIEIIELEDSLQALAKLSESDLNLVIDDLIERIEEEEERQRLEEAFRQSQVNQVQQNQARTVAVGGNNRGAWYFYNPGSVGFGISDFKKIWGNRRLADHWRRSDKGTSSNLSTASLNPDEGLYPEDTLEGGNDPKNRNYYRKNIPFTDDKLKRSNGRIIEALYDLAVVYKDKLKDQPEAAKTFEELLQRYDSTHYHLNTYYQLYLLYDKMGLSAKSDYYKNILLNDYAGTEYARSIRNPEYFREDRVADPEVVNYYKKTYTYYSRGFYSQTIISCDEADQRFPDNRLKPKFDFIKAMSIGHQEGESSLLANLRGVIQDHPNSEVAAEANKIIDYLETGKKEEEARQQAEAEAEAQLQEDLKRYKFDPNSKHDAVLILPNSKDTDINRMRGYISNFNRKYFSTSSLRTTSVLLGTKYHMISIKSFENSKEAMKYYRAFVQNREELKKINGKGHPFFAISFFNSATFYQNEDIDTYQVFFSERYLNETE